MYLTHGASKRDKRLYRVWKTMIHRCENPKREKYADYGARGISVCDEWHDPNIFMDWAFASGYSPELQLDRRNNDGTYNPKNCRWVTPKQNSRNRRNTKMLSAKGKTQCVAAWAEQLSVSQFTIHYWFKHGREYAEGRLLEVIEHGRTA